MKRIGVLTSGGDAPGMNAAIRSVVRVAMQNDMSVIGFKRGYNGLLMRSRDQQEDFEILTNRSVSDKIHRGGTFLMTARCMEFLQREYQEIAAANLKMLGVEGLVCIGGNGTFKGAESLQELGVSVIGVPGTIDNDLAYTDYTIGFDTAVNTALECVNRIRETSDSHERASLVTVMGRDCGDIAVHTALACGAEIAIVPEVEWTIEQVADMVKWGRLKGKKSMILVFAEGAMSSLKSDLKAICAQYPQLNEIGAHPTETQLAMIIEALSGQETRATVLGYTQRGGSPTANDRILATRLGARAAELLHQGIGGKAVGIRENRIIETPIEQAGSGSVFDPELYRLIGITGSAG